MRKSAAAASIWVPIPIRTSQFGRQNNSKQRDRHEAIASRPSRLQNFPRVKLSGKLTALADQTHDLRLYQLSEIFITQTHRLDMIAGVEINIFVFGQCRIDINVEAE